MRKIIYVLIAMMVLSGCSNPLKKPLPNPKPIQNESNAQESTPVSSSNTKNTELVNEALLGSETETVNGKMTVRNPDNVLVLVNKTNNLPSDWAPEDLVIPDVAFPFKGDMPQKYMRKEAAAALEELFKEALKDGIKLYAVSGYRSYSTQQRIYNNEVKRSGAKQQTW
jgi:zinc D-Ala-D-Ala carboxypeptidase